MKKIRVVYDLVILTNLLRLILFFGAVVLILVLYLNHYYININEVMSLKTAPTTNDIVIAMFAGVAPEFLSDYLYAIILILPVLLFLFHNGAMLDSLMARGKNFIIRMKSIKLWWNTYILAVCVQITIVVVLGLGITLIVCYFADCYDINNVSFFSNYLKVEGLTLENRSYQFLIKLINFNNIDILHTIILFIIRIISIVMMQIICYVYFKNKAISILAPMFCISFIGVFPSIAIYMPLGLTMYLEALYFEISMFIVYGSAIGFIALLYFAAAKKYIEWNGYKGKLLTKGR